MPRNVAVLVGNGLSVAFNRELSLQSITEEVLHRIRKLDGDDVVKAMKELADRVLPHGANSNEDFEILVGALGAESRTLDVLNTLAELTEPEDELLRTSIKQVADFAEQVRDSGVAHVLQVIAERSRAYQDDSENLHALTQSIIDSHGGDVVIANLNYDTLLLSALLQTCKQEMADMGHGMQHAKVKLGKLGEHRVQKLRLEATDFPISRRVQLLHLHGSLTYWTKPDRSLQVKLDRDLVRGPHVWNAIRNKTSRIRPAVVLAARRDKAEHVAQQPFALAYEMFVKGLVNADHWLIIGYSFRDEPVNARLREEFLNRADKPKVLVVTYGDDPERHNVERAFGWGAEDEDNDWLTIIRTGADGAEKTPEWAMFTS
ncbi:SIR2 family protein [Leucobacter salsicius]|uniref:SIR2 family protein n=1 Tax=Leucobacter salsicius TaxID=664638 RepID=UPI00034C7F5F|nr:SIR2 family protein [Leucobacter salsicius]